MFIPDNNRVVVKLTGEVMLLTVAAGDMRPSMVAIASEAGVIMSLVS